MDNPLGFWLGEWEVRSPEGEYAGHDVIEEVLGGQAVLEHWTSPYGDGKSLFYAHAPSGEWRQVWIMASGSVKEKRAVPLDGAVRFQGVLADGRLDRTTLTEEEGGSVRQLIEVSEDGGRTWAPAFDGIYTRA